MARQTVGTCSGSVLARDEKPCAGEEEVYRWAGLREEGGCSEQRRTNEPERRECCCFYAKWMQGALM